MSGMMANRKRHLGFTLIELLVVIAIIGILSAVVLVSLNEARNRARYSAMVGQLQEIRKAAEMYEFTHGEWAPDVTQDVAPAFVPEFLAEWPRPSCSKYVYDWENWNSPEFGHIVRISIRKQLNPGDSTRSSQLYVCIKPNAVGSCVQSGTHVGENISLTSIRSLPC